MFGACFAAAAAFVATNIDDLLVLMLLFGRAEGPSGRRKIVLGQYLGLTVLTAVSLLGALGLARVPELWLRLLGLVPMALGVRAWIGRNDQETVGESALSVPAVAALTVANGGDNIGVYLPLFAQMSPDGKLVTLLCFGLLCGLWCLLGSRLAALPAVERAITRHKGWLVPLVFLLLGLSILLG